MTRSPTRDDILRTVIFLFGMGMAGFFLFRYEGWASLLFAVPFLLVAGGSMRAAWFPYGRVIESGFWVLASGLGVFLALATRIFGEEAGTGTTLLLCMLFGWSIYDTARSIRFAKAVKSAKGKDEPPQ